jgi:hypothetical protein
MFKFRPPTIPTNIFVVGCGGTGSRLIPTLVQFIRSITKEHNPTGWLPSTNIVLIDGDIVEQKNLLRQNFIANDVNKNKASVLAMRYGKAYDMNVVAYPKFIDKAMTPSTFRADLVNTAGITIENTSNDLVIMCVDSAEARRTVLKALAPLNYNKTTLFIDAGNEDAFGQVRMFTNHILISNKVYQEGELRAKYRVPERIEFLPEPVEYLPYDHEFYESLQDNPGLGSCADLDQTLAINSLMAMLILSFVQNYYYNKIVDYNEISIDIGSGSTTYTKNTITNYRNKIVQPSASYHSSISNGVNRGFVGSCAMVSAENLFDSFLLRNNEMIQLRDAQAALAANQAVNPEVVVEAPKRKPRAKKSEPTTTTGRFNQWAAQVAPVNPETEEETALDETFALSEEVGQESTAFRSL